MGTLKIGIAGTGFIADVLAKAIEASTRGTLAAVSSRTLDRAREFVDGRGEQPAAVEGWKALIERNDVHAIYVATPTATKEEIALAAIAAGKHVLVDKPFVSASSVETMTASAARAGVAFMDATHFAHHPRTATIRRELRDRIGEPTSLHTCFYFPFGDRDNIRFDSQLEPMGAIGDMAWYSMRAVVEYLQPSAAVAAASASIERDGDSGAAVRSAGTLRFEDGKTATFDVGYTADTVMMDLTLLGRAGVLAMDDFVLDWANSFAFANPGMTAGFTVRRGMATPADYQRIDAPSKVGQEVHMIERFAELAASSEGRDAFAQASLDTQRLLDRVWAEAQGS